jgi:hypothetical protein
VNLISYNNRFKGLGEGAGFFALAGILVGIRNADITSGDKEAAPPGLAAIGGAILFGLGGAVLGTVVGSYQDYIVNEQSYNYHGFNSIELVGGLNIAGLSYSANETNFSNDNMIDYSAGMFLLWSLNNELGIKSGIFYNSKGGSFGQYVPSIDFTFHRDVFLNLIDIPVLFQYSFRQADAKPRFYAGPQIGFFLNGKIDNLYDNREFDISYPVYYKTIDSKDVNNPQISFVIGAGLNFQKHITINILYEYGLSKLSNGLFNGETTNIKVNSFSILLGYQLW